MSISKLLFGEIALKKGLVSKEQVDECLEIQKKLKDMGITRTLGAVFHDKKYLSMVEIKEILREMTGTKDWNAIEGYEILGKLGKGGMGAVYKARHQKLNKIVALKVLPPELAADQEYLNRFMREAQAAAKLNHINIVQALDVGESYGYHYFVMEYAEGKTVKDLIEAENMMDEAASLDITEQIASALSHASKNDLVHRDIKPSNIIVSSDGVAKLLDLGLAKSTTEDQTITQTGVIMGTPFYLSPEQARSEDLDARSDLYSLGVTLFHMVTGQVPFTGNSAATILYKHIFQEPPKAKSLNPKISSEVTALISKMMAKSKDDRHKTPDELIEDIRAIRGKLGYTTKQRAPSAERASVTTSATGMPSLDNTLAQSGAKAADDSAATINQPALGLEVSGPQAAASTTGRTEAITSPASRRARKVDEKGRPAPTRADSQLTMTRAVLALLGGACAAAVIGIVAMNVLSTPPAAADQIDDPVAMLVAEDGKSRLVEDGIRQADALRSEGKLGPAIELLTHLTSEIRREAAASPDGKPLDAVDERALERARKAIVEYVKERAQAVFDEHAAGKIDGEVLSGKLRELELGAAQRLIDEDRARLDADRKRIGEEK